MTIYLYVKTHRKTGLKYLGMTSKKDPHKYHGSGDYWIKHIKTHGYDVETTILHECTSVEEIEKWGLYYSKLWNIVKSDEWANLMEEKGDGISSEHAFRLWQDSSHVSKMKEAGGLFTTERMKKMWEDPEYREKMNVSTMSRREEQSLLLRKMWEDPSFLQLQIDKMKKMWGDPEYRDKKVELTRMQMTGKNNPNYDHKIYHFIHDSGIEEYSTRNDLIKKYSLDASKIRLIIKGTRKSHGGWRVVKD